MLAAIAEARTLPASPIPDPAGSPSSSWEDDDSWFAGATSDSDVADPASYHEAMSSPHTTDWTKALREEFQSLKDLGIYKLVPRSSVPPRHHVMHGCPIFKLKCDEHGNPARFKARYICCGYTAVYGQDYTKTTSPTACMESFQVLAHIGAALDWEIEQLDIKTAFLNGVLDPNEVCFMEQPKGFIEHGFEDHVWELQCSLYGMKQGG